MKAAYGIIRGFALRWPNLARYFAADAFIPS